MKVADYLIKKISEFGIDKVFLVYGAANGDIVDAFTRQDKSKMDYIAVFHEQAGGFAVEGYAKISGKPGVGLATSGPGGQNFVTPIANCFYDSVPAIFITGQVNSQFLRQDQSIRQVGFQETDIVNIVKPITKYSKMITNPQDIRYEIEKSLFLAMDKRPGPVLLDIPIDVQKAEVDPDKLVGFDQDTVKNNYSQEKIIKQIESFLLDLGKSKRPVILVGGGVRISGAVEELIEVGKKLGIPMFPTWNALDCVTSDLSFYGGRVGTYGGRGRNFGIQNSDLLLAVGSRISGRITGGDVKSFARGAKKYLVDVDEGLLQKKFQQVPFDEIIYSDAKLFLNLLSKALDKFKLPDFSSWMTRVAEWRNKYDPVRPEFYNQKRHTNPYVFFRELSNQMGEKDILVGDCGGNIVISNHSFETKKGQRIITNNGNSPMGFSFAGAMGAWVASDKKHNVVCTIGDGGFNMNIQELQTAKFYNMGFKTFIINNHIYGITKAFQKTNFQGRIEACGPVGYVPPDFIKICNAYGVKTFTINHNSEITKVIKEVLDYEGLAVCDVNCHDWHAYEPRIFGFTPIEDMYPHLPRSEFKSNMIIEPMPGWENPPKPNVEIKPELD